LPLQKSNQKYGNEHEAIAVYHMMRGVEKFCPIYTLCVGNAFGEAALLLSAGSKVSWLWQVAGRGGRLEALGRGKAVTSVVLPLLHKLNRNCDSQYPHQQVLAHLSVLYVLFTPLPGRSPVPAADSQHAR
jgi:hypothetical protein